METPDLTMAPAVDAAAAMAALAVDKTFPNKFEAQKAVGRYMLATGRQARTSASSPIWLEYRCGQLPTVPASQLRAAFGAMPLRNEETSDATAPLATSQRNGGLGEGAASPQNKRRCKMGSNTDCKFRIVISLLSTGLWTVRDHVPHTCPPSSQKVWSLLLPLLSSFFLTPLLSGLPAS
jgi:hypothetical protein